MKTVFWASCFLRFNFISNFPSEKERKQNQDFLISEAHPRTGYCNENLFLVLERHEICWISWNVQKTSASYKFWNFCLQQNVQGHWNSSKLVNREDGLQKQFWMLRDFPENWQFRLSQFCMARNSILIFTSKLQNGRDVSAKSWKSVFLSKISFVVICSFCLEISLKISL